MKERTEIVVVTGSSGCLGQHIVKLLQEKDENVAEIRLFDKVPYANNLGHTENTKMKKYIGDIRDVNLLLEAFEGADCVIHTACNVDLSLHPNIEDMKSTNIEGTQNVIDCCVKKNVQRLVFASSTDVVVGTEHIFYGTESTTPIPESFMIGKYGETKCDGEKLVLKSSGIPLANGKKTLRTASIRSTPFFGEEDHHFFYSALRYTKKNKGHYLRVRSLDERLQISYVGNAAWAHIKAKDRLAVDETISGEAFFITDDIPIIDIHEHLQPYLESRGFKVSDYVFPYWLAWLILTIACFFINLIRLVVNFNPDIVSVCQLNYMCSTFFFNRSKATLRLDYQPIYTPEEAKERSMGYYSKVLIK